MKKTIIFLFFIFILAVFSANFLWPSYLNFSIDFLNSKWKLKIPHFPQTSFKLGLDLQGGTHLIYEADLRNIAEKEKSTAMEGLRDVIERRVNLFGVSEPVIQVQGDKLIVELAGVVDPKEAIKEIGKTPFLEFKEQRSQDETQKILDKKKEIDEKGWEKIGEIENWEMALQDPYFKSTNLNGRFLEKAEIGFEQTTSQPLVLIQFNEEGSKIFEELTERNITKPLAIYIDNILISAPVVQEKISGGRAQISGKFTLEEARELARNLNAGALPVPINLISQETVGPILGKISLQKSLRAGIFGFFSIFLFMIIFYRLPGFFSSLALVFYVIFVLSIFKIIGLTLTLAGVAGFLLSMGMAVDANVLIFSRWREELKSGKEYSISLEEATRRAWPAIRDGNFTTILVGLVLFIMGSSFVKGFALTLILGNLVGMITAIMITNSMLKVFPIYKLPYLFWR